MGGKGIIHPLWCLSPQRLWWLGLGA